jgi:hypothetical protein
MQRPPVAKKKRQEPFHEALKDIPVFGYAKQEIMEALKARDAEDVKEAVAVSEKQLHSLQWLLTRKGYC